MRLNTPGASQVDTCIDRWILDKPVSTLVRGWSSGADDQPSGQIVALMMIVPSFGWRWKMGMIGMYPFLYWPKPGILGGIYCAPILPSSNLLLHIVTESQMWQAQPCLPSSWYWSWSSLPALVQMKHAEKAVYSHVSWIPGENILTYDSREFPRNIKLPC